MIVNESFHADRCAACELIVMCEKIMRINKWILVLFLAVTILGCKLKEFSDISNEESAVHLVNTKYKSQKETHIYGITVDKNYKKVVDYYTVIEPPGIAGPEVLSEDILPVGTLIKILKVERCNNCFPFTATERLVIEILSSSKFGNNIVVIDLDRINIEKTNSFTKVE